MKLISIILALAFLLIGLPVSFKAQAHKIRVKTQKVKPISDEAQARKIIEKFIDGAFVKRKFLPILQTLFSYAPCDKIDKEVLDQNCNTKDQFPVKLDSKLGLRTMAICMRFICEKFYYELGTIPIDSDYSYPYSSTDYDKLESEILEKNNAASLSELDLTPFLTNFKKKQFTAKLEEIELNANEIEILVFNRIDNELYKRNIEIMKNTIKIEKEIKNNRKYYFVVIKGFIFGFTLTKRNSQLKIVGMEDGI